MQLQGVEISMTSRVRILGFGIPASTLLLGRRQIIGRTKPEHSLSSISDVRLRYQHVGKMWGKLGHEKARIQVVASADNAAVDNRIPHIASSIRVIPDFPKTGILFQDITTLLLNPKAFKDTIDLFVERYKDKKINVVAGIEARGFIFGPPIALAIGAKFVPMRKPNRLPGKVISEEYSLEYGTDIMEMHVGAVKAGERVLVVDDLIATGGTLSAAIRLLERVEAEVIECACVIELPELKGREKLGDKPVFVLVS